MVCPKRELSKVNMGSSIGDPICGWIHAKLNDYLTEFYREKISSFTLEDWTEKSFIICPTVRICD